MTRIFYDADADPGRLEGRAVAVVGYGNQGRAQALNMRDSGVERILVGNIRDKSWETAESDGFLPMPIEEAVAATDIVFMLVPDEVAPEVYREQVGPFLGPGKTLNFASGYNIAFGHIVPPEEVDVIMVAPRMIGEALRSLFTEGKGAPCFVDAHRDASGNAWEDCLAVARAIGCTRSGALQVSMEQETWMDLLTELGVWPLILSVFLSAYELQVEAGIPPEAVLLELYASKEPAEVMERAAEMGIFEQMKLHSRTSRFAHATRLEEVDRRPLERFLREALVERIQSGRFDREWTEAQQAEKPVVEELLERLSRHPIAETEKKLREALGAASGGEA
ncbi:MAG TPA: ketol-acid reductoisomerase [Rubrobacteraceae bacterium]|nr:ketol-acid reductoisomerase [Rubrobacteraceae bacterium]